MQYEMEKVDRTRTALSSTPSTPTEELNPYHAPVYDASCEATPTYELGPSSADARKQKKKSSKKGKASGNVFNRMVGFLGVEGIWPDTMDREIDKASRILSVMTGVAKQPCNIPDVHASRKSQPFANKIPHSVLRDAKGIAIMTMARTGLSFSGAVGSGIVMAKFSDGTWSCPSAFAAQSLGVGVLIGFDVYDVVLVLRTIEAVQSFTNPKVTLGGGGSIAAGPVGEGSKVEGGYKQSATVSYVKTKGLYIGAQVDTTAFFERSDENRRAYGRKVKVAEILSGKVDLVDPSLMTSLRHVLKDASRGSETYWDRCSANLQHGGTRAAVTSPGGPSAQHSPVSAIDGLEVIPRYVESPSALSSVSDLHVNSSETGSQHSIPVDHKYNPYREVSPTLHSAQSKALEDMGFTDREHNEQVLSEVDGNIIRATEVLLGEKTAAEVLLEEGRTSEKSLLLV